MDLTSFGKGGGKGYGAPVPLDAEKGMAAKFTQQDEELLSELHEIARTNTNFAIAGQLAVRATIWMCLFASWVWIPALGKAVPDLPSMALVACLFVFTINPLLGTSIQLGICGFFGTLWAVMHVWFMNLCFPGGMTKDHSPASWCAVFIWANFLLFLWFLLWAKCGIGMKMFALSYDIGFCLTLLDPNNPTEYGIQALMKGESGPALKALVATFVACLAAPLMNLLPYPMSLAYKNMKDNAQQASKDISRLFEASVIYYTASEGYSVILECELKHSIDIRTHLNGMGTAIGAAWFEGFDSGTRGTVRALMQSHLGLMDNIYDRLRAMLLSMQDEDFADSHVRLMERIRGSAQKVAVTTRNLLCYITEAACDGSFSESEKKRDQRHDRSLQGRSKRACQRLRFVAASSATHAAYQYKSPRRVLLRGDPLCICQVSLGIW